MKQRRYNNPQWLTQPSEAFWGDSEKMKWRQFYNENISHVLKALGLLEDPKAQALAQNLWHSAKADAEEIRQELQSYKDHKKIQEDVQKMHFLGYMNSCS